MNQPDETERERVAQRLAREPKEVFFQGPYPKGPVSEKEYHLILRERLSKVGIQLDSVRDRIITDDLANKWFELKKAVATAKNMSNPYKKVDVVIDLEKRAGTFVDRLR